MDFSESEKVLGTNTVLGCPHFHEFYLQNLHKRLKVKSQEKSIPSGALEWQGKFIHIPKVFSKTKSYSPKEILYQSLS